MPPKPASPRRPSPASTSRAPSPARSSPARPAAPRSTPSPSPVLPSRPATSAFRCAVVGDVHFTATPPSGRTSTYAQEIHLSLDQVGRIAAAHDVDIDLYVGDLLHSKGRTTHGEVASLAESIRSTGKRPRAAIPGNHDMQGNNVQNAMFEQPYAVLAHAGVFHDLANTPLDPFSEFEVVVAGVPFGTDLSLENNASSAYSEIADAVKMCAGKPAAIVVLTHDEMTPDGSVGRNGTALVKRLMDHYGCPVAVVNGHLHVTPTATPVTSKDRIGGYFINIGSLARTSISDSDDAAVAIVDFDYASPKAVGLSVKLVPITNLPRVEAFVDTSRITPATTAGLDDFVAALQVEAGDRFDPAQLVTDIGFARKAAVSTVHRAVQLVNESR